ANIKLTKDGAVKVLDFGLARMREAEGAATNVSNSPTLMSAASMPGMIMGTAAYMSPEQAKGRPVDRHTDIFAFGCVLYEMLSGRATFEGDDVTEILRRVVTAEPDWNRIPAETQPGIHQVLRRSLKKDPRQRLGDIRDARLEIEDALSAPPQSAPPVASPTRNPWLAWIVAAVMTLAFASIAVLYFRQRPQAEPPQMRVQISTPSTPVPSEFALSSDGRYIVAGFCSLSIKPKRLLRSAIAFKPSTLLNFHRALVQRKAIR